MISNKQEKRIRKMSGLPLPEAPSVNLPHNDVISGAAEKDGVRDKDDVSAIDVGMTTYGSLEEFGVDTHALTDSEGQGPKDEGHRKLERTRVMILVTALSVHSLFEGLAMGLQNSNSAVWTLFIAIATHKAVIAFSTGLQITKSFSPLVKPVIISVCVFSVMSPLGGAIGTVIIRIIHRHDSESLDLMNAVLQSIASGTFMYITFFEILVQSVTITTTTAGSGDGMATGNHANIVRVLAVMVGFSLMAGLAVLHCRFIENCGGFLEQLKSVTNLEEHKHPLSFKKQKQKIRMRTNFSVSLTNKNL